MPIRSLIAALPALFLLLGPALAAPDDSARVTLVFDQALPNAPGKSMKVVLVEYAPGGSSPAHLHPASAFIYARVLQGAVRSKVNDGPDRVYQAGEAFTEMPGDRHLVSANASSTEPSQLLAVFIVDSAESVLVRPLRE
jgi:quercetin dioxygenase-like cupin family protein